MEFKDILKDLRIKRNLSQQALANAIYVSRSAVAKWENGLGLPNEDSIDQLMKFFNVDHDYLFPIVKQEDLVVKNMKLRKFKFGYFIGCLSSIIILFTITIVCVTRKNTIDEGNVVEFEVIPPSYGYQPENSVDECQKEDNIYYKVVDEKVVVCGYDESDGNNIVIKSTYEGYPVTRISADSFANTNIETIIIPESITSIGRGAFSNCKNLTSFTIYKETRTEKRRTTTRNFFITSPETETSIGAYAFSECSKLVNITLPKETTIIGKSSFYACTSLKNIILPDNVNAIYWEAFQKCTSLENISLPEKLENIGRSVFDGCTNLKSIFIPKNVKSIDYYLLSNCPNVESIVVDSENTVYDSRDNCNAIINTEDNTLLFGCKNTIIPNSITTIGMFAFQGQRNMTCITIPNSVVKIENQAFEYCTSLTSITIPKSVTSINGSVFSGCNNLIEMVVDKDNPVYDSRDNCNAIIYTENNSLIVGCKASTIPSTIVSIEANAFINCQTLTSISIPNSIKSIGKYAFSGCIGLTNIVVPGNVTSIKDDAFWYCTGLTKVTIEEGVKSIGAGAFAGCINLNEIIIPHSVVEIKNSVFTNCGKLKIIRYNGTSAEFLKIIKDDIWDDINESYTIYCIDYNITK